MVFLEELACVLHSLGTHSFVDQLPISAAYMQILSFCLSLRLSIAFVLVPFAIKTFMRASHHHAFRYAKVTAPGPIQEEPSRACCTVHRPAR